MLKKVLASFILALQNIRSQFFHTLLSLLGIVIGVAALVSILSLIDGMEQYAKHQVTRTTSLKAISIRAEPLKRVDGISIRKDSIDVLSPQDFEALRSSLKYPVRGQFFNSVAREINIEKDTLTKAGHVTGIIESGTESIVVAGRKLTPDDIRNAAPVALLTEPLARALAGGRNPELLIGKIIDHGERRLSILGIVKRESSSRPEMFFPITLLSQAELMNHPPQCVFEAENVEDVPALKEQMMSWLKERFGKTDDFNVATNDLRVQQAAKGFKLFRIVMGLIVGISVLVGGIGVMNVLLISVTERTAEIGVRKAVGANKRDIVLQFLSESIAISLFGSFLGLLFGMLATMVIVPVVKAVTDIPFQAAYTLNTCFIISILAIVVGVVFGTYPAMRAARLDPVEAIRREN